VRKFLGQKLYKKVGLTSGHVIIVLIRFKCKMKDYSTLASHMVDMILQQVIQHINPLKNDTLNYPPWKNKYVN
jgi:hypothetical protein